MSKNTTIADVKAMAAAKANKETKVVKAPKPVDNRPCIIRVTEPNNTVFIKQDINVTQARVWFTKYVTKATNTISYSTKTDTVIVTCNGIVNRPKTAPTAPVTPTGFIFIKHEGHDQLMMKF